MAITTANVVTRVNEILQDFPEDKQEFYDGDGTTVIFDIEPHSIVDGSESVWVASVARTRDTHYTINNERGIIDFSGGSTPHGAPVSGTDNIEVRYQATFYPYASKANSIDEAFPYLSLPKVDTTTIDTAASTYTYDLPSDVKYLEEVSVYNSDGDRKARIRDYEIFKGTGTGGVDQIHFHRLINYIRDIHLSYRADVTAIGDLPDTALNMLAYFVCWQVLMGHEVRRGQFSKLPAYDEKMSPVFHGLRQGDNFRDKFIDEAKRLRLWDLRGGYTTLERT